MLTDNRGSTKCTLRHFIKLINNKEPFDFVALELTLPAVAELLSGELRPIPFVVSRRLDLTSIDTMYPIRVVDHVKASLTFLENDAKKKLKELGFQYPMVSVPVLVRYSGMSLDDYEKHISVYFNPKEVDTNATGN